VNRRWLVFVIVAAVLLVVLHLSSVGLAVQRRRDANRTAGRAPAGEPEEEQEQEGPILEAPWVQNLRRRLSSPLPGEALHLEEGPAGCRIVDGEAQVPPDAECEWEIAPGKRTHVLRLRLVQGSGLRVTLDQEDALTIDEHVPGAHEEALVLDVYRSDEPAYLYLEGCEDRAEGEETQESAPCLVSLNAASQGGKR
jgi:hypothetical protein